LVNLSSWHQSCGNDGRIFRLRKRALGNTTKSAPTDHLSILVVLSRCAESLGQLRLRKVVMARLGAVWRERLEVKLLKL
jgi:hypothetical protein